AERDVLAQRQVEHDRVLEYEADLRVQALLLVLLDGPAVVFHRARGRLEQSGQEIQQLRLAGGRRADHGGSRAGLRLDRDVAEDVLAAERQRDVPQGEVASQVVGDGARVRLLRRVE